jgi:Ion channel
MIPLRDYSKRWRFLILLGMLLVSLVVQPIVFGFSASPVWFDASFLLVTVALLFTFSLQRKWRTPAYALGILSPLLSLGGHLFAAQDGGVMLLVGHLVGGVLLLLGLAVVVHAILVSPRLTVDSVFGAICGYLLLGMAWALLYSAIDSLSPGSFAVSDKLAEYAEHARARIHVLIYYSFVTLTTVGYGDVTPVTAPARTCAWFEAMSGQFYLAVLVAGLVGALISNGGPRYRTRVPRTADMSITNQSEVERPMP